MSSLDCKPHGGRGNAIILNFYDEWLPLESTKEEFSALFVTYVHPNALWLTTKHKGKRMGL